MGEQYSTFVTKENLSFFVKVGLGPPSTVYIKFFALLGNNSITKSRTQIFTQDSLPIRDFRDYWRRHYTAKSGLRIILESQSYYINFSTGEI